MNYELKDKITLTKELLSDLEMKSWQEIEHLQTQIANLDDNTANNGLRQLLKNLLTSYYVFAGGIEALGEANVPNKSEIDTEDPVLNNTKSENDLPDAKLDFEVSAVDDVSTNAYDNVQDEVIEPFEYFVDFDEPVGDPITDDDLYNN